MTTDPTPHAPVLLVTGPAGAGKTTTVNAYTRTHLARAVHLSLDDARDRVTAGYADPADGWTDEAARQYALARRTCAATAMIYTAEGYPCFIDDAIFPDWPEVGLTGWLDDLDGLTVGLVVITATLETLLERNATRSGRRQLGAGHVQAVHDRMATWREHDVPIIDTSQMTPADAVEALHHVISSGRPFTVPPLRSRASQSGAEACTAEMELVRSPPARRPPTRPSRDEGDPV